MQVALIWQDTEINLARGEVKQGHLEIVEPLPELGIQGAEIAPSLLKLKRLTEV